MATAKTASTTATVGQLTTEDPSEDGVKGVVGSSECGGIIADDVENMSAQFDQGILVKSIA